MTLPRKPSSFVARSRRCLNSKSAGVVSMSVVVAAISSAHAQEIKALEKASPLTATAPTLKPTTPAAPAPPFTLPCVTAGCTCKLTVEPTVEEHAAQGTQNERCSRWHAVAALARAVRTRPLAQCTRMQRLRGLAERASRGHVRLGWSKHQGLTPILLGRAVAGEGCAAAGAGAGRRARTAGCRRRG